LFGAVEVLNDMDVEWFSILEDRILPAKREDESDPDSEEEAAEVQASQMAQLDMSLLANETRELNKQEIAARKEAEALAISKLSKAEKQARKEAAKAGKLPTPTIIDKRDGASNIIIIPREHLQARGWIHKIEYRALHRPSLRLTKAYTRLKVAPKGSVWKVQFDEPVPFKEVFNPNLDSESEESDDENNISGGGGGGGVTSSGKSKKKKKKGKNKAKVGDSDNESEESDGPPDPFADVNNKVEIGQYETRDSFDENTKGLSKGLGPEQPDRVPGLWGGLVRGKYENDADWLRRLELELEAAIKKRKEEAKKRAEEKGKEGFIVEDTKSVFDQDSQKVMCHITPLPAM
jgi:hypothetical protein